MSGLSEFCRSLPVRPPRQRPDIFRPVRTWHEKDVLSGTVVDAFVVIFMTKGCSWAQRSGCTMCGYGNESAGTAVPTEALLAQLEKATTQYKGEPLVKIFNSGSFFDDAEISPQARRAILSAFPQAQKVSVESRPEFVDASALQEAQDALGHRTLEVGIGLETANDLVRKNAINKGFTFAQYEAAVRQAASHHVSIKTYVLTKPPFLTEQEAIDDSIGTIRAVADMTSTISLNPVNVQRNTVVEFLWRRSQYRPPWLWSLVEILKAGRSSFSGLLKCDVVGGGSVRGPHNCGTCDRIVLSAIESFSLSQEPSVFDDLSCSCQDLWRDQLAFEQLTFGSVVDFARWKL